MPPSVPPLREILQTAETLLIATAGGVVFTLIGFPAGLVAGSMLAVALSALIGRPMQVPLPLARVCFVLVGILLGAVVTPEMLEGIATWPASIAILAVSAIAMFGATACYLRFVHGWDPLSALLGASPGSMAQVLALSAELGADLRGVAIVQTMRVLLIVLGLPAGLALFGLTVGPLTSRPAAAASLAELALLCADRRGAAAAADHRRHRGIRAGRAGHHDGARARASSRPDLCGDAPPGAVSDRHLLGCRGGAAHGRCAAAAPALEAAGAGDV